MPAPPRMKRGLEIAGESRFWIFRLGGLFVVLYNVYSVGTYVRFT